VPQAMLQLIGPARSTNDLDILATTDCIRTWVWDEMASTIAHTQTSAVTSSDIDLGV
jgi:hypothetical protein